MTSLGVHTGWYDLPGLIGFQAAVGVRPDVALVSFDDVAVDWNGARVAPFVARGIAPELTWGPVRATLCDIAAGRWDTQIAKTARWTQGTGVRVRFGHEMNGAFSPYHGDPALYVKAWKRARQAWRQAGSQAPWVWSPNVTGGLAAQDFAPYYPGDDQCELVGLDGYSYPKVGNPSFADVFDADLITLGALSSRPLAICETGVDQAHPDRAGWITGMWRYLLEHPRVEHVTYWNREEYQIDDDPAAALAFHLGASAWHH